MNLEDKVAALKLPENDETTGYVDRIDESGVIGLHMIGGLTTSQKQYAAETLRTKICEGERLFRVAYESLQGMFLGKQPEVIEIRDYHELLHFLWTEKPPRVDADLAQLEEDQKYSSFLADYAKIMRGTKGGLGNFAYEQKRHLEIAYRDGPSGRRKVGLIIGRRKNQHRAATKIAERLSKKIEPFALADDWYGMMVGTYTQAQAQIVAGEVMAKLGREGFTLREIDNHYANDRFTFGVQMKFDTPRYNGFSFGPHVMEVKCIDIPHLLVEAMQHLQYDQKRNPFTKLKGARLDRFQEYLSRGIDILHVERSRQRIFVPGRNFT